MYVLKLMIIPGIITIFVIILYASHYVSFQIKKYKYGKQKK